MAPPAARVAGPRPLARVPAAGGRTSAGFALGLLFVALVLYAAFGKGFAYAGLPPVYVGELLLAVLLFAACRPDAAVPRSAAALLAACLLGLAVVQAGDDLLVGREPWLEIARGLAPLYYAGFAFATFALLRGFEGRVGFGPALATVESALARVAPLLAVVVLALFVAPLANVPWTPTWPGSGAPLLVVKSTDLSVTLVLIAPALTRRTGPERRRWPIMVWAVAALLAVFRSRGALLGIVLGLLAARPHARRVVRGVVVGALVLVTLYVSDASLATGRREVSFRAAVNSTASLLGENRDEGKLNFAANTNFRIQWWGDIWADVTARRMVWHGNGWGDNLAIRYGVKPTGSDRDPRVLRAPHSIFFSLAGRAGLITAVGFLLVPLLTAARSLADRGAAARSFAVEGARGAVVAAVVVGLTDVYLESPQGGIVLWSLIGFLWWAAAARADGPDVETGAIEPAP
jgi:hypothetical protein